MRWYETIVARHRSCRYLDYVARNPLAGALLLHLESMAPHERNYLRLLFADPRTKDFYEDWESMARTGVALLGMQAVGNPHDARLTNLVGELSINYPLLRQWRADRHVHQQEYGRKTIIHPELGEFTFDWDSYYWTGDPDQHVTVWSPEPGSPSERRNVFDASRLPAMSVARAAQIDTE